MKLRHVLSILTIFILLSSVASAGFFGSLLSIITGRSVADEGFYVEFQPLFDLSGSATCNGHEKTYILKSTGSDMIEIPSEGVKTKEVYVTKGGCKGIYYKDLVTGKAVSLKAIGADLIIGNRHYSLTITNADLSKIYGAGYKTSETSRLTSDEKTMTIESANLKVKTIYLYEAATRTGIIYPDLDGNLAAAASTKERIIFDMSPTLVPKKTEQTITEQKPAAEKTQAWDEKRVASIETQLTDLSGKVDALMTSVEKLGAEPIQTEETSLWNRIFRG